LTAFAGSKFKNHAKRANLGDCACFYFAPILPENKALGGWTREDKTVGEDLATGIAGSVVKLKISG
jgi:hypothetical protein